MIAQPPDLSTRDKLLWAAATLLGEQAGSILSVRAIAARAGVSTGALQHYFPAKQDLIDEAMAIVYDLVLPAGYLEDPTVPARDRLVACLQQVMSPPGVEISPRQAWQATFERYLSPDAPADAAEEYLAIERELVRRIEHCLTVLSREGAIAGVDHHRTARALLALTYGISTARALPPHEHRATTECDLLQAAADTVLLPAAPPGKKGIDPSPHGSTVG